jgi:AcrR family transcriptional regulator
MCINLWRIVRIGNRGEHGPPKREDGESEMVDVDDANVKPLTQNIRRAYNRDVADPRVLRTQLHVLTTARRLLVERSGEPLNFTILAKEAQVSRRTLYTHWGTIERVISASVTTLSTVELPDQDGLSGQEKLSAFLLAVRDSIADPVTAAALASLVGQAPQDDNAAASLAETTSSRIEQFRERVAPIETEQFTALVGPIYFSQFVMRESASDELVESLVARGTELLGLESALV